MAGCIAGCTTCSSAPDVISGFTIVRNAVTLDYPIVPAIRSILELCDEVVVNVGQSDDDTRDVVAGLGDRRVRIIDSVWDFSHGSGALAHETNRAMAACRGAWGVYIQADEVRLGREIRSYQDAQGFRVGPEERRVRARATGAPMFHYGWARPSQSMRQKFVASQEVFPERVDQLEAHAELEALYWTPLLRRFTGSHPRAAEAWVAARRAAAGGPAVGPRRLKVAHLRLYLSDWFERLTGARPFEYRNYVEV